METMAIDLEGAEHLGIAEAKARLSALVERAELHGETSVLERYGRPAALIVPLPRPVRGHPRARGLLATYADEEACRQEKGAFARAMVTKHGSPA